MASPVVPRRRQTSPGRRLRSISVAFGHRMQYERSMGRRLQIRARGLARDGGTAGELPERLVLGVGAYGRLRPSEAVIAELERRGVRVECLPTDAAVRRYGELDERSTAAALHLTC